MCARVRVLIACCAPPSPRMHAVCRVCRVFKEQVIAAGCPRLGILPLLSAIKALRTSTELLTPIHADCFQL